MMRPLSGASRAVNYLAFVQLASIRLWLRVNEFTSEPTRRGNDAIVPMICPTRQMVSENRRATAAVAGYFAWGCFRYFVWAFNEASGRTDLIML
jgi:hypothetical protein